MDFLIQTFESLVENGESYVFLLPIYVGLLVSERVAHLVKRRAWDEADSIANIAITVAYLGLNVAIGHLLPVALFALLFALSPLDLGGGAVGLLAAFVLYDLAWYVDHRIAHRTGLFWALHHVHHSSNQYNMTVASRGFLLDVTRLTRPTFFLLPLLGVSPTAFILIEMFTNIFGIFQHSGVVGKMPWLDRFLATPSNHRVHHGSDPKYLDRNYGEVLMIWDRLLGTYQAEEEEPTYGVTDPIHTANPAKIQVAGLVWLARKLARMPTPADKLRCLILPPGWEPAAAASGSRLPPREA